jgi:uncharacterized zinc-type alcohol dehydrogenase-like protein
MKKVTAYAAYAPREALRPFEFTLGALGAEQVDVKVEFCGICHSDLSMIHNDWGMSTYPLVPGHEIIGIVEAVGERVSTLSVGQRVGIGWFSGSCMYCSQCMSGDHNLCHRAEQTIVARHGGFADRVRCNAEWAIPLPEEMDAEKAGPLFCGGATVFNPLVQHGIRPTDRVGVIGIGGLGHLALQFLNKWGCEVTAFTSSTSKAEETVTLGAHHAVHSKDDAALGKLAGTFDFILNTVNVSLNWGAYINALAPRGIFHTVGAVPDPIAVGAFDLIGRQRSVSGSPVASPEVTRKMVEFSHRHGISAITETFAMQEVNAALAHLHAGRAKYRVVLKA